MYGPSGLSGVVAGIHRFCRLWELASLAPGLEVWLRFLGRSISGATCQEGRDTFSTIGIVIVTVMTIITVLCLSLVLLLLS